MTNCDTVYPYGPPPLALPANGLCDASHFNTASQFLTSKGLQVNDAGSLISGVAYVLISHGESGLGAYLPGTTTLVNVGACSLIGKPQVAPGDVIEARYLYNSGTTQSPTMYQPRMTQVRYDKEPLDCTTDQFGSYTRKVLL